MKLIFKLIKLEFHWTSLLEFHWTSLVQKKAPSKMYTVIRSHFVKYSIQTPWIYSVVILVRKDTIYLSALE